MSLPQLSKLPSAVRLGVYCSLNPMRIELMKGDQMKGELMKGQHMKASLVLTAAFLLAGCSTAPAPAPAPETKGVGTIVRLDSAFDALVPKDAIIERVAGGFQFTEGPLWRPDGHLWFSDVTGNVVRSITTDGK